MIISRLLSVLLLFLFVSGCVESYNSRSADIEAENFMYEYNDSFAQRDFTPTGSLFADYGGHFASGDSRAAKPGDILTVVLQETNILTSTSTSNMSRSGSHSLSFSDPISSAISNVVGGDSKGLLLDNGIGTDHKYSGSGKEEKSNNVQGSVSVAITKVFPNGNYYIRGIKKVRTNSGDDYVKISGIIRPNDISPENTIESRRIANAEISFLGSGDREEASRQGWLGRFLTVIDPI